MVWYGTLNLPHVMEIYEDKIANVTEEDWEYLCEKL
jgi:hypothetical protein